MDEITRRIGCGSAVLASARSGIDAVGRSESNFTVTLTWIDWFQFQIIFNFISFIQF